MLTREQKILFCFIKVIRKKACSFNAVLTAKTLSECGISCDPISHDDDESAQCLILLDFLFNTFSCSMPEKRRQEEYAIFRLVLGATHQALLGHCSLNQSSTDNEIDGVYCSLKKAGLGELHCGLLEAFLGDILRGSAHTVPTLANLLASCGDTMTVAQLERASNTLGLPLSARSTLKTFGASASGVVSPSLSSLAETREKDPQSSSDCLGQGDTAHLQTCETPPNSRDGEEPLHSPVSANSLPVHGPLDPESAEMTPGAFHNKLIPSSTANIDSDSNMEEIKIYKFAFEEVGVYWKELGILLGFQKQELDAIDKDKQHLTAQQKAWEMLHQHFQWKGWVSAEYLQAKVDEVKRAEGGSLKEGISSNYFPSCVRDDPFLAGRNGELRAIEEFFWQHDAKTAKVQDIRYQKIQVLCGHGGVGKTSLANRYAVRHASAYSSGVFYFNSESSSSLLSSLEKNLSTIELLEGKRMEDRQSAKMSQKLLFFFDFIRRNPRSLILLDSADSLHLLAEFLPSATYPCHIIITTRQGEESEEHRSLFSSRQTRTSTLTSLENEAAVEALLLWAGKDASSFDIVEQRFAQKVACSSPVEGLPIALAHAGTCVRRRKLTFRKYWERLRKFAGEYKDALLDLDRFLRYFRLSHLKEPLFQAGVSAIGQLKSFNLDHAQLKSTDSFLLRSASLKLNESCAFLTWEMDLDEIEQECPEAFSVLSCCSLFASQDIPQEIVEKACSFGSDAEDSKYHLESGIRSLSDYSLIREVEGNDLKVRYNIHHLIQQSVVKRLYTQDLVRLKALVQSVEKCFLGVLPSPRDLEARVTDFSVMSLSGHAYSVSTHVLRCEVVDECAIGLPDVACRIALELNHLLTALDLGLARVSTLERMVASGKTGGYKKRLSTSYFHMSTVCHLLGRSKESEHWLNLSRKQDSSQNMEFYDLVALAQSYQKQGRLEEAESLLLSTLGNFLSKGRTLPSECHLIFLVLSGISGDKGNYRKKLEYLEKGLQLHMSYSGPQTLRCAQYFCHLGFCLKDELRDPERALPNFQQALYLYTTLSTTGDRNIPEVISGIASCEMALGRVEQALDTSREAFRIAKFALPSDSPDLVPDLFRHAKILSEAKRYSESIDLFKECLSLIVSHCSVVDDHNIQQHLRQCASEFLGCSHQAGKLAEAASYMEELLTVVHANYSPDHLFKAEILFQLGCAYFRIGRKKNIVTQMLEESLQIYNKQLPIGDPRTVDCGVNLAHLYIKFHRFKEATQFLERMVTTFGSVFSHEHEIMRKFDKCRALLQEMQRKHPDCVINCIHASN